MTSTGLVVVFAALMGVLALLAIAVDWIGKPIRNRKFQPRIYRYDDEQQVALPGTTGFAPAPIAAMPMPGFAPAGGMALPSIAATSAASVATGETSESPAALSALGLPETSTVGTPQQQAGWLDTDRNEWGGSTFALPDPATQSWGQIAETEPASSFADLVAVDTLSTIERADIETETLPAAPSDLLAESESFTSNVTFQSLMDGNDSGARTGISADDATHEPGVWRPGDPLWSPTIDQMTPDADRVHIRFWQSAAVLIAGTRWYGADNVTRLADGAPPQRLNRRTGQIESMTLEGLGSPGQPGAPRPYWPSDDIDPFQN